MPDKNVALRKRQQIENAGRTMFVWVALAAAVVGIGLVLSVSLFQRMQFRQEVIGEKNNTVATLRNNNEVVNELKDSARVLNTSDALLKTPHERGTEPISVVLDALPSQANSSAFGASLQQKLLSVGGVEIESLIVDPVSGVEDSSKSNSNNEDGEITFSFTVNAPSGKANELKKVLLNLEKSIRPVEVTSINIEQQSSRITMSAQGKTFFVAEKKVELTKKKVP